MPEGAHPTQEQWARKMCQGPAERSQQDCSMPANCEGQHQRTVFGKEHHRQPPAHCLPPTCRHIGTDSAITPGTQPSPRAATCNAGLTLRLSACSHPPWGQRASSSTSLWGSSSNADGQQAGSFSAHALPLMGQSTQHTLPKVTYTTETQFW